MDLAALKLLCAHFNGVGKSEKGNTLGSILFQRAWVQGVVVSEPIPYEKGVKLILDDGTGTIDLYLAGDFLNRQWETGMYLMVVGRYYDRATEPRFINVHKIVDLSAFPERETMWYLEVIEAFKLFYQPSMIQQ